MLALSLASCACVHEWGRAIELSIASSYVRYLVASVWLSIQLDGSHNSKFLWPTDPSPVCISSVFVHIHILLTLDRVFPLVFCSWECNGTGLFIDCGNWLNHLEDKHFVAPSLFVQFYQFLRSNEKLSNSDGSTAFDFVYLVRFLWYIIIPFTDWIFRFTWISWRTLSFCNT